MVDCKRSSLGYNWEKVNEHCSDGKLAVCSGRVFIGVWLVDGKAEFFGSVDIEVFLGVFVAVGIICGQELIYWRTELGSGICRIRVVGIGGRGVFLGYLKYLVQYFGLWVIHHKESLVGELASKNGKNCEGDCGWVVMIFCGCLWVVVTDVWVWSIGVLLGVTVYPSGEYGADGLWFEDEESGMSVPEFRYAVYSGKVWNECVELDDELFFVDEGEGLWLSIVKYFYFGIVDFQFLFQLQFLLLSLFNVLLFNTISITIYLQLSFSRILRKRRYILFTKEKSIVFSWLWAEIVSVIGVSSGINIVIVVMKIRLVFWVGIFIFCSFSGTEMGSIG